VDRPLSVSALLCRTSDRTALGAAGARALAGALASRAGVQARIVGAPGEPREGRWEDDLRDARGCLLEAGGQAEDALAAGARPVLLAGDCSICLTTLPAVLRAVPDVRVLWLDAHADFNSPGTTPSGFLGGMCLSAACGVWDAGLDDGDAPLPALDPARVVMCGVRDVDAGERVLLDTRGVGPAESPSRLAGLLSGSPVFVHLDLDVLDPAVLPGMTFPVPGGMSLEGLGRLLGEVAAASDVVGVEVTSMSEPGLADELAAVVGALL